MKREENANFQKIDFQRLRYMRKCRLSLTALDWKHVQFQRRFKLKKLLLLFKPFKNKNRSLTGFLCLLKHKIFFVNLWCHVKDDIMSEKC